MFDNGSKFNKQISSVAEKSFYQLRLLAKIKPSLNREDLEKEIQALITLWLDYKLLSLSASSRRPSLVFDLNRMLLHLLLFQQTPTDVCLSYHHSTGSQLISELI